MSASQQRKCSLTPLGENAPNEGQNPNQQSSEGKVRSASTSIMQQLLKSVHPNTIIPNHLLLQLSISHEPRVPSLPTVPSLTEISSFAPEKTITSRIRLSSTGHTRGCSNSEVEANLVKLPNNEDNRFPFSRCRSSSICSWHAIHFLFSFCFESPRAHRCTHIYTYLYFDCPLLSILIL